MEQVLARWDRVLLHVRRQSRTLEAILRDAKPAQLDGDVLTLAFDASFHRDHVDKMQNRIPVERALRQVLQAPLQVRAVLSTAAQAPARRSRYASPMTDPFVMKAAKILGAQVLPDDEAAQE